MKTKKIVAFCLVLFSMFMLMGCTSKEESMMVGTWKPRNDYVTYTFSSNGKFAYDYYETWDGKTYRDNGRGTWTLSNGILTMIYTYQTGKNVNYNDRTYAVLSLQGKVLTLMYMSSGDTEIWEKK